MNNAIRAWLEWHQTSSGEDEAETVRAHETFVEANEQFTTVFRAFQGSRKDRIGNEFATPSKAKGAAGAGVSGNNDALVAQVQRLVAVGESIVDMAAFVRISYAADTLRILTSLDHQVAPWRHRL